MLEETKSPEATLELSNPGTPAAPAPETARATDPLDAITDPEALRHEAKKYRGIASRSSKDEPGVTVVEDDNDEPEPTQSDYMTKRDFYRVNEKKAIAAVTADPEIAANFDGIKAFYTPRRGKDTPEEIVEDIKDAYILWKARNPKAPANPSATLTTTSVPQPGGLGVTTAAPEESDPRFRTASSPSEWYRK